MTRVPHYPTRPIPGNITSRTDRSAGAVAVRGAVAALWAVAAVLAAAPAEAQNPTVQIERGGHPASIQGGETFQYRLRATGNVNKIRCRPNFDCSLAKNQYQPGDPGGSYGPRVGYDFDWKAPWHRGEGSMLPGSGGEAPLVAVSAEGKWYWDRGQPVTAAEDRPLLLKIQLNTGSGYTLGSSTSLRIAVNPQIEIKDDEATEGTDTHAVFKVRLRPEATETVTVNYATSAGTATGGGTDYADTTGTLTFNVGEKVKTISVPITDDTVSDDGETFTLTLSSPSGKTRLVQTQAEFDPSVPGGAYTPPVFASTVTATGTIRNTEPGPNPSVADLPLVSIRAASTYVDEGSDAVFMLARTGDVAETLQAAVTARETGAMLDASVPTQVTFPAGETEAELRIATVDDDAVEDDSRVTVSLGPRAHYRLGTNDTQEATLTVLDDDAAPTPASTPASSGVTVWSADMTVVDYQNGSIGADSADQFSNQGGSAGLTARWLWYHAPTRTLRMAFTTAGGAGKLYAGNVALDLPPGGDSSLTWHDVDPVDWTDGQTLEVRLVQGEREASASADAALGSLTVSDAALSPAFDADTLSYTAVVNTGAETVTVSAAPRDGDAAVAFEPAGDADLEQEGHQVAVPHGETLITATVTAADGETQRAYRVVAQRSAPAISVSFGAASYTATEGGDPASVVVQLGADPGRDVTIPLTAAPAGGAAAEDYTVPASVTFTSGGALSQSVDVTAVSDEATEDGESVTLGFGSLPDGIEASGTTSATVTLADADATSEPEKSAATGAPTISETAQVDETLTASVSGISDADGLENVSYAYQWIRGETDIGDATDSTYTLVAADEGETIKVRVSFTDDAGNAESLTSAATDAVAAASDPVTENSAATGAPTISGTAQVNETLTASVSGISDADGLENASYSYQWIRGSTDIGGATGSSYALVSADEGETIKVRVSFTDDAGNAESLTSAATDAVAAAPDPVTENSAATGAPTISGTAQVDETLTASVSGIDDADGLENASYSYQWIRGSTDIGGATDSTYTLVDADEGETIKVRVSFTDDAGNAESLTSAATDAVAAAPEPLTASFSGVPAEHAGEGRFTFDLTFSEDVEGLSFKTLRDEAFDVSGGTVRRAKRKQSGSNLGWIIHVEPASDGPVTIRLPAGSVETADGRALSNSSSATVAGPVGISVADARVEEAAGAVLEFVVTLSRAAGAAFTVAYQTADGSAQAGNDYTAANGTLSFQTGDTSKTIEVAVLDDAHDEDEETLTLTLSNASSGLLTDAEATGTIKNHDPMPRALLARFGRTAAVHVVEHVEERMQAPREPGFRGRFAGRELRRGMERDMALSFLSQLGGAGGVHAPGAGVHTPMTGSPVAGAASLGTPGLSRGHLGMGAAAGPMGAVAGLDRGPLGGGLLSMGLGGGSLLTGSAFSLNRETRQGGLLSFWSRGAQSSFFGREGALGLGGDVRTTMFGADYAKGPLVAGLSLSHSRGLGSYDGLAVGQVASSVTGLYPWLGYKVTDRVSVWGVTGYGAGGMLLTPEGGPALESGLSMKMAAAGTRGELVAGGPEGFGLAFKADALWVGTAIDGVDGSAGRLAATEAAVSRFRTALEGSRGYTVGSRLSLTPSVEVGLRHDAGDAETGAGMDLGGGLVVSDAGTGLAVDVRVRMLVVHQAEGFRERGMALTLSYNPTPSTPLGFNARVAPSWGGQAMSGAQALWGRETMAGMAHGGSFASGNRLDGEVGYGLPVGNRFVGTPRVGFSTSEYGKDYRFGYGLGVLDRKSLNLELGVDAHRRESPMLGGTDKGLLGQATLGW